MINITKIKKFYRGNSNVELLMVVSLIFLFGTTMHKLILQSKSVQQKILSNKVAQTNARIALSFVNLKIRQNDVKDKIFIKKNKISNKNSLVIRENTGDIFYDTWIYFENGKLMECIVDIDEYPQEINSSVISDIHDFEIYYDEEKRNFFSKVIYIYDTNNIQNLSSNIYFRSN